MAKLLALILVGLSVGLGNFAASIAIGLSGISRQLRLKLAIVFGLFETGMPIVGLIIGQGLANRLGGHANLIGGGLLVLAGIFIMAEAIKETEKNKAPDTSKGLGHLMLVGLALSIDNLIVGFGLGAHKVSLWTAAIIIGITSVSLSLIGLELGGRLGPKIEEYSELFSGLILIIVGVAIVVKII